MLRRFFHTMTPLTQPTLRQDDEIWQKLKAYEELLLKFVPQLDEDNQKAVQDAILMVRSQKSDEKISNDSLLSATVR